MIIKGLLAASLLVSGAASRYDPGVFREVSRVRGMPDWDGAHLAVLDCDWVGRYLWLCHDQTCVGARVTDCAGVADGGAAWMINGGYAAELDYETSSRLGCLGKTIQLHEPFYHHEWF
jgi:hypothetical protein